MSIKILLTNDDGVHAKGIRILAQYMKEIGEVYIAAPNVEVSGCGRSITIAEPIRIKKLEENIYAVKGTPSDCINAGIQHICNGQPDLAISGINLGQNVGQDIFYSGTIAGAWEAIYREVPAFAISLATFSDPIYESAAKFAQVFAKKLLSNELPNNILYNINIPNLPYDQIKGVEITKLGSKIYKENLEKRIDPIGRDYYWFTGVADTKGHGMGSDCYALQENKISITPIKTEVTDLDAIKDLQERKIF
ncbi:MAG: 5'/3'-nucleotidase SurE [Pseudomonadota bacterium]